MKHEAKHCVRFFELRVVLRFACNHDVKHALLLRMSVRDFSFVLLGGIWALACNSSRAPGDSSGAGLAIPSISASGSAAPVIEAKPLKPTTRDGSSITRAPKDDVLFIADEDHRAIYIVPFPITEETPVTTMAMPGRPAQIVASKDRIFVTIREMPEGGGGVLLFQRDGKLGLKEIARISVATDAWGIALSPDESFVGVTSAWAAKVSFIDLATAKVRAVVDVGREPRGMTILPDGKRAYVSHLVGREITHLGDIDGSSPVVKKFDFPPAVNRRGENTNAALGYSVIASPRGDRIFFPRHALGTEAGDWFGASAIDVWVSNSNTPLAPPLRINRNVATVVNGMDPFDVHTWKGTEVGAVSFIQPRAAVYRASRRTLLVASEGTDQIMEFDALMQDPSLARINVYDISQYDNKNYHLATTCGAPSGIALSENEQVAYVHCRSTDDLVALRLIQPSMNTTTAPPISLRLVKPKETPEDQSYQLGRALYYNATDEITSGNLGCAGCHPDGRDDGHVWHEIHFHSSSFNEDFVNFMSSVDSISAVQDQGMIEGGYGCGGPFAFDALDSEKDKDDAIIGLGFPRQTPMLAGRVSAPGPYGWHAESDDLIKRLIGGFGLHRWRIGSGTDDNRRARAGHIAKFIREGLVPPESIKRELTDEEKKGKEIFESEKAQCSRCHVPATGFTDRAPIPVGDPPKIKGFAPEENKAYKTPSLLYVRGTAPYFHDGRYQSLQDLVEKNPDTMGKTMHLSADQKKALVAYLETL